MSPRFMRPWLGGYNSVEESRLDALHRSHAFGPGKWSRNNSFWSTRLCSRRQS